MVAHALLVKEYIHIFNLDFIELLKLFWEYHIQWQLICGVLDALLQNFLLDILFFQVRVKLINLLI